MYIFPQLSTVFDRQRAECHVQRPIFAPHSYAVCRVLAIFQAKKFAQ